MLTFKSSESNELIPLLDSLPMGDPGDCFSGGDNAARSVLDKNPKPSKSMLRAIYKNKHGVKNWAKSAKNSHSFLISPVLFHTISWFCGLITMREEKEVENDVTKIRQITKNFSILFFSHLKRHNKLGSIRFLRPMIELHFLSVLKQLIVTISGEWWHNCLLSLTLREEKNNQKKSYSLIKISPQWKEFDRFEMDVRKELQPSEIMNRLRSVEFPVKPNFSPSMQIFIFWQEKWKVRSL